MDKFHKNLNKEMEKYFSIRMKRKFCLIADVCTDSNNFKPFGVFESDGKTVLRLSVSSRGLFCGRAKVTRWKGYNGYTLPQHIESVTEIRFGRRKPKYVLAYNLSRVYPPESQCRFDEEAILYPCTA